MKFVMVLPTSYPAALNKLVLDAAEQVGADSLWVFDHLLGILPAQVYPEMPISEIVPDNVSLPLYAASKEASPCL